MFSPQQHGMYILALSTTSLCRLVYAEQMLRMDLQTGNAPSGSCSAVAGECRKAVQRWGRDMGKQSEDLHLSLQSLVRSRVLALRGTYTVAEPEHCCPLGWSNGTLSNLA